MNYIEIDDRKLPLLEAEGYMNKLMRGEKRHVEGFTAELTHADAISLFRENTPFALVQEYVDDMGETQTVRNDKSHLVLPCGVMDHLDGTVTVYMGEYTNEEILLMEVLCNV